jgi:hypothetical protein
VGGGAQEGGLRDARQGAAAVPIIHQSGTEHVLADALDDQALGLGRLRQIFGLGAEAQQRHVRQTDRKPVDPIEPDMKLR